jgi:transcriptional regulator with XRE-family HTH domain
MDDKELNLVEMGEMLRERRGGRPRRELAERTGLSASQLQKVEEGRAGDITLSTLSRLAIGYELSPLELLSMSMSLTTDEVVAWVVQDEELHRELEKAFGRRVVVEAQVGADVHARLDQLGDNVRRLTSLVAALSSLVVGLQQGFERHSGAPIPRGEEGEVISDLLRSLGRQD